MIEVEVDLVVADGEKAVKLRGEDLLGARQAALGGESSDQVHVVQRLRHVRQQLRRVDRHRQHLRRASVPSARPHKRVKNSFCCVCGTQAKGLGRTER